MDGTRFASLVCLFLSYVLLSNQMTSEATAGTTEADGTSTTEKPVANYTFLNCTTSRKMSGNCVERVNCDYNTTNIDLTVYAPREYHSTCLPSEVCCPMQFVLPPKVYNDTDNSLFDDDSDEVMS